MMDLQPWSRTLNASVIESATMKTLEDVVREAYRDMFKQAVADGTASPTLFTHMVIPMFIAPLWLSIPHTRRSWLYNTRWAVAAFVLGCNVYHLVYTSSMNFACMYAAGLASTWATMLSMNLLIWTRPQFDAARVIRVRKLKAKHSSNGEGNGAVERSEDAHQNGHTNGRTNQDGLRQRKLETKENAKAETKNKEEQEFDYVWQPYPADASFLERFGWSLDLLLCFRGTGWNWSISPIPRPAIPLEIRPEDKVDMDSIPEVTRSGYRRCLTEDQFIRDRTIRVLLHYLVLDFFAMVMTKDPYFVLGPDHYNYKLPPALQSLPSWLLIAYRELAALLAIISAIDGMFSLSDIIQYRVVNRFFPSRGAHWHYVSIFGSFDQVLERGLAGWWGSFWHQTFRVQFIAPMTYLLREGYLKKGTQLVSVLGILVTFLNSGFLHASGSVTAVPKTKPWRSVAFFMLQAVGILLQQAATKLIKPYMRNPPPRTLYRTVNFLYVFAWLYFTAPLFVGDMSSSGIWLFEPVPVSIIRLLGFGPSGEHWWRWDRDAFPKFHVGERWWQSGVAV